MAAPSHERSPKEDMREDEGPPPVADDAIDDSEDADEDYADLQKSISGGRRVQTRRNVQELLPFTFAPNICPLTICELDSCEALEKSAFSEEHQASREKLEYRLSLCPELCLGLFCTVVPGRHPEFDIETVRTARPVDTARNDGSVSVLLAHIVSTRCNGKFITDEAMKYPANFKEAKKTTRTISELGHQEAGRTVAIHSLAVHPKLHGCGLGKLIMKAYLQLVKDAGMADRVSLICQDYLVNYYKKHGFAEPEKDEPDIPSVEFGGGGWRHMTIELGGQGKKP